MNEKMNLDVAYANYCALIARDDRAVERAILALYALQTQDERAMGATRHQNGVGFNYHDAGRGAYWGEWVRLGRRLTGKHLYGARAMVRKYGRQLLAVGVFPECIPAAAPKALPAPAPAADIFAATAAPPTWVRTPAAPDSGEVPTLRRDDCPATVRSPR